MKSKEEKIQELAAKKKADKIIKFTNDSDDNVRAAAFRALGEVGGQAAEEALQNAVRDPSPAVRMAIAKAFQKCGNDHVSEALHHQMLQETDPTLREEMKKAMDNTRGKRAGD